MYKRDSDQGEPLPSNTERLYEGLHFLQVASKSFLDSTVPNQSVDERVELKKAVEEARVLLVEFNPETVDESDNEDED